jgi:hypothetical protein
MQGTTIHRNLHRCHHPNLSSIHVAPGVRAFIASGDGVSLFHPSGAFSVAAHGHRTDIDLIVLQGSLINWLMWPGMCVEAKPHHLGLYEFDYVSGLMSGDAPEFKPTGSVLHSSAPKAYWLRLGMGMPLGADEVHTVSCTSDAIWLVVERQERPVPRKVYSPVNTVASYKDLYQTMSDEEARAYLRIVRGLCGKLRKKDYTLNDIDLRTEHA